MQSMPNGLDGELIVGDPVNSDVFNITQSGIMTISGEPNFKFYVFDKQGCGSGFESRFHQANLSVNTHTTTYREFNRVEIVRHFRIDNAEQLQECANYYVGLGYEGVMVRSLNGPYKFGRSTEKEGYLLKYKPFQDADAIIIGVEELMHNNNEAIKDEFGRTKRSSHKANLISTNTMGALNCQLENGIEFDIGTGFTDKMRADLWADKTNLIGQKIKFKYQNLTAKSKPRLPVFLGFRKD
jgi:DNA ligase-1